MSYIITTYSGKQLTIVADGTIDNTTELSLVGKNYSGYGTAQNENFLYLLENFSNSTAPSKPITGQLWFDSSNNKLKFYDSNLQWRVAGGADISTAEPSYLTEGDFWFDTTNKQLYVYSLSGSSSGTPGYVLVGPPQSNNQGTSISLLNVTDTTGSTHDIIEAVVDGATIFTVSTDVTFTLDDTINAISGFNDIHQGITLCNTTDPTQLGQTLSAHRFWGTATDAEKLGGVDASVFVHQSGSNANFADTGFTIGSPIAKLKIYNETATTPTIQNLYNNTIQFQTTVSNNLVTPLKLVGEDLLPGTTSTSNIGSSTVKFNNIYANYVYSTTQFADNFKVGSIYVPASTAIPNNSDKTSVVSRDAAGDVYATVFHGVSTSAEYADLAEKYLSDDDYETGTVVMVGGDKEVTACQNNSRAIGVVSANPAYMMNKNLEGGTYIALKGRVPVKVIGEVKKGDSLVASNYGVASVLSESNGLPYLVFAIALESSDESGVKLIEAIIL